MSKTEITIQLNESDIIDKDYVESRINGILITIEFSEVREMVERISKENSQLRYKLEVAQTGLDGAREEFAKLLNPPPVPAEKEEQ